MADNPPASPSKPSVMFTALVVPTKTRKINIPYPQPSGIVKLLREDIKAKLLDMQEKYFQERT